MGFSDQEATSYPILKEALKSKSGDLIPGIGRRAAVSSESSRVLEIFPPGQGELDLGSCKQLISHGLYWLDPSLVHRGAKSISLELGLGWWSGSLAAVGVMSAGFRTTLGKQ